MAEKSGADVIELRLPARVEYIGIARLTVSGIANRLGLSFDEIEDLKLAVGEACTNAVQHAYGGEDGTLRISCKLHPDRIVIEVADQGTGFSHESLKKTLGPINHSLTIEDVTEGGLGLYLIHSLMDEVEIHVEAGVVVSMTKYLRRDEVAGDDRTCPQTEA
jgi:serine/threonine-protein kinase RsbW